MEPAVTSLLSCLLVLVLALVMVISGSAYIGFPCRVTICTRSCVFSAGVSSLVTVISCGGVSTILTLETGVGLEVAASFGVTGRLATGCSSGGAGKFIFKNTSLGLGSAFSASIMVYFLGVRLNGSLYISFISTTGACTLSGVSGFTATGVSCLATGLLAGVSTLGLTTGVGGGSVFTTMGFFSCGRVSGICSLVLFSLMIFWMAILKSPGSSTLIYVPIQAY